MALVLKQPGYLTLKIGGKILTKGDAGAILHVLAPSWRTADAGNGQQPSITFGSPLDPSEIKYYTIDWTTEMDGTEDTIAQSQFSLLPAAVSAGLLVHATTKDARKITVWFKIDPALQGSPQWLSDGEIHTMSSRITTANGQIFERTIRIPVKQL